MQEIANVYGRHFEGTFRDRERSDDIVENITGFRPRRDTSGEIVSNPAMDRNEMSLSGAVRAIQQTGKNAWSYVQEGQFFIPPATSRPNAGGSSQGFRLRGLAGPRRMMMGP